VDAWTQLKPGDPGFTFDTTLNKMLTFSLRVSRRVCLSRVCTRLAQSHSAHRLASTKASLTLNKDDIASRLFSRKSILIGLAR
jgi:hypothetical protein